MRILKDKLMEEGGEGTGGSSADAAAAAALAVPVGGQESAPPVVDPADAAAHPASSELDGNDTSDNSPQWGNIADELDGAEDELLAAVPAPPDEPVVPAVPPVSSEPKGEVTPPVPVVEPPVVPPQAATPPPVDPLAEYQRAIPTPMSEEEAAQAKQHYVDQRGAAQKELKSYYTLSEEQADALSDNPAEVLPELFANMYLDMYEGLVRSMHELMPPIIGQVQASHNMQNKAQQLFYSRWGDLKGHEETVERYANAYMHANPQATFENFLNDVGIQSMVSLGLAVQGVQVDTSGAVVMPNVPPPVAPTPGGAAPPAPAAQNQNAFTQLSEMWEDDD